MAMRDNFTEIVGGERVWCAGIGQFLIREDMNFETKWLGVLGFALMEAGFDLIGEKVKERPWRGEWVCGDIHLWVLESPARIYIRFGEDEDASRLELLERDWDQLWSRIREGWRVRHL